MILSALLLLICTIGRINARVGNIKTSNQSDENDANNGTNFLKPSVSGMVSSSGRNLNNVGSLNFTYFHNDHCTSGWMGGNKYDVETVDDCAAVCSARQGCGFFAYDNSRKICATYFESDDCLDDNHFPKFKAYKIDLVAPKIVGGVQVNPKDRYPFQVALTYSLGEHFCGGSLIAPGWVLSAAHCAGYASSVQIGRWDLSDDTEDYEDIQVDYELVHPDYDYLSNDNDFMLLKLNIDSIYSPISIDDGSQITDSGTDVTTIGWGDTSYYGNSSDILLEVEVDIVGNAECNVDYSGEITDNMLCAARVGKDACQSDSGGPLVIRADSQTDTQDVLVGIVSWGYGCASPNYPGVYARVSKAYDWISQHVRPSEFFNLEFVHNGHCATGWMGDNRNVETINECATICDEREECGYFSYDKSMSYTTNCATYFESDGCPDDNLFPEYKVYKIITSSTPVPSTAPLSRPSEDESPEKFSYSFFHNGHCASGWMGDNRNVETVDECATICGEREGCGYFAYDNSISYATNCATYFESQGCPDDNLFFEFNSYKIGSSYRFLHEGHCATGWMGENRNIETVDECATVCGEREGCGYFAYDDSISHTTNCATYFESYGCPDDNLFPEYKAYEIVGP